MKVTETRNQIQELIQQQQASEKASQGREARQVSGVGAQEERVTLSDQARDIQQARQALSELPEVREEKVAELKARIDNGSYRVDGDKVAEKMIGESLLDILA